MQTRLVRAVKVSLALRFARLLAARSITFVKPVWLSQCQLRSPSLASPRHHIRRSSQQQRSFPNPSPQSSLHLILRCLL